MTATADLTLGAAQLGMDYGVANKSGQLSQEDVFVFLSEAYRKGVRSIDTSPVYGNSEELIGSFVWKTAAKLKIVTKLPSLGLLEFNHRKSLTKEVLTTLKGSLKRLSLNQVEHYLVHSESDFIKYGDRLVAAMKNCCLEGLAKKIGVSVYTPEVALQAIDQGVEALQLPCNIFDHRFAKANVFLKAEQSGVEILARSIFLQGLFFLDIRSVEKWLPAAVPFLFKVQKLAQQYQKSIAEIALIYMRNHSAIKSLIVGMENRSQLEQNMRLMQADPLPEELVEDIHKEFLDIPVEVVNPSMWRSL